MLFLVIYFAPARQPVVGINIGCKNSPPGGLGGPGGLAGNLDFCFDFFFWSQKWPKNVPLGPWGVFSGYFWAIFGPPGANFFLGPVPPWGPISPILAGPISDIPADHIRGEY